MNNQLTEPAQAKISLFQKLYRTLTVGRRLLLYRLYSWLTVLRLRAKGVQVGTGLRVYGWVDLEIHPTAVVVLEDYIRINSGFALNAVGGYRRTGIWVGREGTLRIGKNVGISNCTVVCSNSITIGENVFIGGDCKIYDTDFHPIYSQARVRHDIDHVKTSAVTIGPASFIGAHTLILKGVTIGAEAVIGAGSVVTTNVPAGEIWAGIPARRIAVNQDITSEREKLCSVF